MKNIVLLVFVTIVAYFAVMAVVDHDQSGFTITIQNNLDQTVNELTITYPGGPKMVSLKAHSKKRIHIVPKVHGEGSIKLEYETGHGKQESYIFGYIEPGYSGKATVDIDSSKENGELDFKVKDELDLY
ncbi:hypothetical protein A8990_101346 [Paenibacillus taihuensis]|uniref:Uncharacterized protein n=1 Tax=Paenibacillus taihuensis TaxID=1156355 RepID=A0A3D9SJL4_9BACL|nr:hypothetical protein [Paenibacillus taihuensis]REE94550.1 hypothetical protein A8990_101346 [Paenibacillus taihuensis]